MAAHERPPDTVRARLLAAAAVEPASAPGAWRRRVLGSAVAAAAWLALVVAILGVRSDWPALPVGQLVGLLAVAGGASVVGLMRGRSMVGAPVGVLSTAVWGAFLGLVVLVIALDPAGPSLSLFADGVVAQAPRCVTLELGIALPLVVLGVGVARGLTLARPGLAGVCIGLAAATWAHAVVRVHCPIGGAGHGLLGHLLPALPTMAAGAWASWVVDRSWRGPRGRAER